MNIKPHPFQYGEKDVFGRSWCAVCGLPKQNQRHDLPDPPAEDAAMRAAGDAQDDDEGQR